MESDKLPPVQLDRSYHSCIAHILAKFHILNICGLLTDSIFNFSRYHPNLKHFIKPLFPLTHVIPKSFGQWPPLCNTVINWSDPPSLAPSPPLPRPPTPYPRLLIYVWPHILILMSSRASMMLDSLKYFRN